ncbi:DNA polymerase III subunit gamma/tau [Ethanoligenens harbinense]|uniref:DNA-directed DNA polymerase n=1 Tax=Ethanoligenens harbinense (strain DSM 18485 / JCM 12961 / CGMCC 1.5033 / YUAN-3) TaxID=663278 RepID=E6U6L9_ETHHY|nr:DNA polymerase III subunit gamma/tau [Ethanoligenens harbinense]ADU25752.1 DNA polymerase III, subunits gamma and tau [Ethanoligenens harbinense YUAN-3]AVQ97298.1 DNA polymerase III subunit gamma/tau [Ethanoligenens harbinense YUAN-3]AYF39963.1 DNA polymerase III subunit gamma/tau [Ethanoligenens harbinense]AYF42791.1 DNA polymerase III subunit gamma/tau [Ethanoligenens harbinense]QCN93542.1 DNA polymerase III subunit gamma/tau [Ethanoligenens harbinense]
MYQALYRKWRPRTFEDVAGQPQIVATLLGELRAGRVAHAYLFTGSRGTGKTTCAKILAKAVNCLHPQNGDPCGECAVCRGIDDGSLTDVVEIDAASNNGVDSIRALREETVYTPAAAKYRVYIIDEAHMLSAGAFNALLKTLEEPPAYVLFILATTEAHKIPATILSRCQRFDFRRIPPADIAARLLYVAEQEHIPLTQDGAEAIARLADGALRDALSLLDTCANGGGDAVDEEAVARAAGLAGRDYLYALSDAVHAGDAPQALRTLDELYASAKDADRLCEELIGHFRAIMLTQAGSIPPVSASEAGRLQDAARDFDPETVLHALDTLQHTAETLRRAPVKRVEMEMGLLRLCNPALDTSPAALLRRIAALETQVKAGGLRAEATAAGLHMPPGAPARGGAPKADAALPWTEPPAAPETPAATSRRAAQKQAQPENDAPPADSSEESAEPLACWPEVLEELGRIDPPLRGVLDKSKAVVRGAYVLVDAGNVMFADLIRQPLHQKPLVEAVRTATGKPYKVGVFKSSLHAAQKEKSDDPFDALLRTAMDGGVPIREKEQ